MTHTQKVKFHIAVVNGVEIDGQKEEVPFLLIYQNDNIEKFFLVNQEKTITLNIINEKLIVNFENSIEQFEFELHQDYLRVISVNKKINFGVINEKNELLYCFSFDNIGGL